MTDTYIKLVNGVEVLLTEAEIDALEKERVAAAEEAAATEYIELRLAEYPPLGEQFDMIYHDSENGTTNWFDTLAAIKAKYPKPTN
jgi:hypothetical protein